VVSVVLPHMVGSRVGRQAGHMVSELKRAGFNYAGRLQPHRHRGVLLSSTQL
jgi:hypothetical protein